MYQCKCVSVTDVPVTWCCCAPLHFCFCWCICLLFHCYCHVHLQRGRDCTYRVDMIVPHIYENIIYVPIVYQHTPQSKQYRLFEEGSWIEVRDVAICTRVGLGTEHFLAYNHGLMEWRYKSQNQNGCVQKSNDVIVHLMHMHVSNMNNSQCCCSFPRRESKRVSIIESFLISLKSPLLTRISQSMIGYFQ